MNNVQLKIQELERKTRQALISQEQRAQKVGKMFWDAQQAERYPNLSENLALPTSNDTTLGIDGTEEADPTVIFDDIKDKLLVMTSNSKEITRYILRRIDNIDVLSYLKEHWDELKAYLRPMSNSLFNREKLTQQILKFLKLNKVIENDAEASRGDYNVYENNYGPSEEELPSTSDFIDNNELSSTSDFKDENELTSYSQLKYPPLAPPRTGRKNYAKDTLQNATMESQNTSHPNVLRDDIVQMSEILNIPYEFLDMMSQREKGKKFVELDVDELKEFKQEMKKEVEDMNAQQEIKDPSYIESSLANPLYDDPSYKRYDKNYVKDTLQNATRESQKQFLCDKILQMTEILKIPGGNIRNMFTNGKNLFEQDVVELKELYQVLKKEVEYINAPQQEIKDPSYADLSYNDPYADFTYFPPDEETFTTPIKNEKDIEKETKSATLKKKLDKRIKERENDSQDPVVNKIMTQNAIEKEKIQIYVKERQSVFETKPLNAAIKATFNGRTVSKIYSLEDWRKLQNFLENYEGVRVTPLNVIEENLDDVKPIVKPIGGSLKTYKSRTINFVKPKSKKKFYGRGFTQTNLSPKLFVDLEHLKGNKLTVKYRSTQKIQSSQQIPNEELKQVIIDLIIGKYDDKRYNKLSKENKAFIDRFITNAKVTFEPIQSEEQKLKAKWDILCGERQAGNDNPEITKMLLNVASRLYELKSITKNKYLQIKNELVGFSPL